MKIKLTFLAVFTFSIVFSQLKEDIEKIKSSYNFEEINLMLDSFDEEFNRTQSEINTYLKSNTNVRLQYFDVNGTQYTIKSIIDGKPIYMSTDNAASAAAYGTNRLHTGGIMGLNLNGQNMNIGIWDGGWVLSSHIEFMDNQTTPMTRVVIGDGVGGSSDDHGTHVGGTIAAKGVDFSAKGMAPESNLFSYNWTNDLSEVTSEASNNALLISNHSYGVPIFDSQGSQNAPDWMMGCYNSDAANWDQIAFNAPYYLMVTSAGNSGDASYSGGLATGYDKLTENKNSKNNLVVANANVTANPITGAIISMNINSSSSQGPSDDGRIKPDIAGDGTNVYSTYNDSNTTYATLTGTSMASPGVAGSLLLLQQHYYNMYSAYMKSATLKGLVCHTAYDDAVSVGPDPKFGWGLLDAAASVDLISYSSLSVPLSIIEENTLNIGSTYSFEVIVNNPQKLTATLCWTDRQGNSHDGELNSSVPALTNDLDLRIIKGAETNYPWKLQLSDVTAPAIKGDNIVDTVEKVEVENAQGTYTIEVSHKGFIIGALQDYSLIVSGFDSLVLNNENFTLSGVAVYPNPATNTLNINSTNSSINSYEIYDIQGRLIESSNFTAVNEFSVNLEAYKTGMYMVKIFSNEGSYTQKFLKK